MRKWHRQACQCSGIRHRRRNQLLEPAALVLKNVSWQSSAPHPRRTEIVICSRWYPGGVLAVPLPVARLRGPPEPWMLCLHTYNSPPDRLYQKGSIYGSDSPKSSDATRSLSTHRHAILPLYWNSQDVSVFASASGYEPPSVAVQSPTAETG